ncbi:MAG: HAD family hydrolase [Planctomycetota bacterium]
MRIAMWSGPRNISTAMMRSWGNRADCYVCDEPLYAHYLLKSGQNHPGREATIAAQPGDWREVADWLTGEIPGGKSVWYQKHMAHHLLPEIDRDWTRQLINCFLIRDPREMITSLIEFIPVPTVMDTGLPQQVELFEDVRERTGAVPPVIDGRDVLENPEVVLSRLCEKVGTTFDESMLNWPPGIRETDGAWAPWWYDKVKPTTGFAGYRPKDDEVPNELTGVYEECVEYYAKLAEHKIN